MDWLSFNTGNPLNYLYTILLMASIHLPADATRQVLDDQPEVGASRRSVLLHPNWFSLSVVVIRAFTAPEIGQSIITFEIIFWPNKLIKNSVLNF
jgi:hypothetical protein